MTWDASKWVAAQEIFIPSGPPNYPVFLNTANGIGVVTPYNGRIFTRQAWTRIDLSGVIPPDAKAVFLQGILIITHGQSPEIADLAVNLKPPSSPENPENYEGQVCEADISGGQRSPFAAWVGVEDGKFDFWWKTNSNGPHPQWSSFGVSLTLQAFAR